MFWDFDQVLYKFQKLFSDHYMILYLHEIDHESKLNKNKTKKKKIHLIEVNVVISDSGYALPIDVQIFLNEHKAFTLFTKSL